MVESKRAKPAERAMRKTKRWTVGDLDAFPDDGKRYEIIDGELYVAKQPDWFHQRVGGRIFSALDDWDMRTGIGMASLAPGVIFAEDEAVAPDVVWISQSRLFPALDQAGHLLVAPELVVEILSPGAVNERRDRETKLEVYSRRGVREYWIVDWHRRQVEVYRHTGVVLEPEAILREEDVLTSPLLPGFTYPVSLAFIGVPQAE
jgi:Uma2 family endonuclease